ncbi:MAG: alcohol dehydrogenase catalytic domain-containing protein [Candidatus Omnitrophica bacterium]|nr:alcohol dehydrogenase catalytic domain-containing protein [Candidatus Omnitrophota bacterium]
MLVAVYHNNNDVRLEERPVPEIGDGELLVKVMASGICGTDIMQWYRLKKGPRVLGHEIAGYVVKSNSERFVKGDRIFVSHHVPCNSCKYCLSGNHTACDALHAGNYEPGGFSEFIRAPKENVDWGTYILPDYVTYEEGTMIEPLACVIRGQRIIDVQKYHTVLVLGSGISGLMNIQLAKLKGARVIATDIDEYRLRKAKELGADEVINANKKVLLKADKIIVCTGAYSAIGQAFANIDKKGIILLFAVPKEDIKIPNVEVWRNELTITSSYGAAPVDLEESLNMIKNKEIQAEILISHKVSLKDIQQGFKIASESKESLKVIVKP